MTAGTTIIRETDNSSTIILLLVIIIGCVIAWFYFNKEEEETEEIGCDYEIDEIIDEENELWGEAVPDTRVDMSTIRVSAVTTSTKRIPYM